MSGKASVTLDWLEKILCLSLANTPALFKAQNSSVLFDLVAVAFLRQPEFRSSQFIAINWKWLAAEFNICRNKVFYSFFRKAQKRGFVQPSIAHKRYEADFISSSPQRLPFLGGKT